MKNLTAPASLLGQAHNYNTSKLLAPIAQPFALELTDDEKRKNCCIFQLPADVTGLDQDVLAVCEPAAPWQWLNEGALVVFNAYYAWEDDMAPAGEQFNSEVATHVGRIVTIDREARMILVEEAEGIVAWPAADLHGLWLIGRAVAEEAASAQQAA